MKVDQKVCKNMLLRLRDLFAILSVLLWTHLSLAQQSFEGFIDISDPKSLQLYNPRQEVTYVIRALTAEADLHLKKLKQHDFIRATGEINNKVLLLNRIEQVGLTQLLGEWISDNTVFNFENYSEMTMAYNFLNSSFNKVSVLAKYNYIVAPSLGSGWRIFLTDDKTVSLGSLFVDSKNARIEILNPENGQVIQTINLSKKGLIH